MDELCRLRRSEGYGACNGVVRVERCGKSAPGGSRVPTAVNSIRSNTAEETRLARPSPRRWLERTVNGAPR